MLVLRSPVGTQDLPISIKSADAYLFGSVLSMSQIAERDKLSTQLKSLMTKLDFAVIVNHEQVLLVSERNKNYM